MAPSIAIMGVPFDNVTSSEAILLIEEMIASRRPHYLATANVDFLVQAQHDAELRRILFDAHLVLCDGTPLLWASHLLGNPLPERIAGSDLVPLLIRMAAEKKYRIFFLGGAPETTERAVVNLQIQYPDLVVAGHYSPPFDPLLEMDHEEIIQRIQAAKPDLLFVSFGCPKAEKWFAMHYRTLGVPVGIGVGATIDFLAGRIRRSPLWMRQTGTEWIFRLLQEPRRLFLRYAIDLWYFSRAILAQWWQLQLSSKKKKAERKPSSPLMAQPAWLQIKFPERLDLQSVLQDSSLWEKTAEDRCHCLLELGDVKFVDSTGIGLLISLQKKLRATGRQLVLLEPSLAIQRAFKLMRLQHFFTVVPKGDWVRYLMDTRKNDLSFVIVSGSKPLAWHGEITAANAEEVWRLTETRIRSLSQKQKEIAIDLSGVRFIDSTGVAVMIRSKKQALRQGASLRFIHPQPIVRNVLQISKLENFLLESSP